MSLSINDLWLLYLKTIDSTYKSYNDENNAVITTFNSDHKSLMDKWFAYLRAEGCVGTFNDMMYTWLGSKGYTGALDDRIRASLLAQDMFETTWTPEDLPWTNLSLGMWVDAAEDMYQTASTTPSVLATANNDPIGHIPNPRGVIAGKAYHIASPDSATRWKLKTDDPTHNRVISSEGITNANLWANGVSTDVYNFTGVSTFPGFILAHRFKRTANQSSGNIANAGLGFEDNGTISASKSLYIEGAAVDVDIDFTCQSCTTNPHITTLSTFDLSLWHTAILIVRPDGNWYCYFDGVEYSGSGLTFNAISAINFRWLHSGGTNSVRDEGRFRRSIWGYLDTTAMSNGNFADITSWLEG